MNHSKDRSTESLRISERFPDISALGRAVGFDLGFRQLDDGDPSVPATALVGENVTLTHMRFACRFHQLGMPPAEKLSFGIPIVGLSDWFGRRYRTSSILPFNHPGGIDGVSERGFEAITVSFSEDVAPRPNPLSTAVILPRASGACCIGCFPIRIPG